MIATRRADIDVSAWVGVHPGVRFLPYHDDELIIVAPKSHPLACLESIPFEAALGFEFVALSQGSAMQRFMDERARELKAVITPRVEVDNQQLLLRLVDQGLGIAVTSQKALSMSSARNIAWVRLKDAWAQRHLRIAVHEKAGLASEAVKRLAGFLMEQAAAEP